MIHINSIKINGRDMDYENGHQIGVRVWEDHGGEEALDYRDCINLYNDDRIEQIIKKCRAFADRLESRYSPMKLDTE